MPEDGGKRRRGETILTLITHRSFAKREKEQKEMQSCDHGGVQTDERVSSV